MATLSFARSTRSVLICGVTDLLEERTTTVAFVSLADCGFSHTLGRLEQRRWKKTTLRWGLAGLLSVLVPAGSATALQWARTPAYEPARPKPKPPRFERQLDMGAFLKGNLHTHTNRSDGDSPPEDAIAWYRKHGYAFLAITDHNRLTDARTFASLQDDKFRLLNGEEITMKGAGRQVHVNALCTKTRIGGGTFHSAAEALAWATARVSAQGGVAIVNHPNFDRALVAADLLASEEAPLLEVMSGHPYVYSLGTATRPSHEALWDSVLGAGARMMGVAVDDVHHLRVDADPPAYAGRGWVQVAAPRNDPEAICDALKRGQLYASTGVVLEKIRVTEKTYAVWPAEAGATVSFYGQGGRLLAERGPLIGGASASYALLRGDRYVRAKVVGRDSSAAWTPAVFATAELETETR
jgi:hypothetical protein